MLFLYAKVDLGRGIERLKVRSTKNKEARRLYLAPELQEMLLNHRKVDGLKKAISIP